MTVSNTIIDDNPEVSESESQANLTDIQEATQENTTVSKDAPANIDESDSTDAKAVYSGDDEDSVKTGSGNDTADTGGGNDNVDTGDGDDIASVGDGDDGVNAGGGDDIVVGSSGNDVIDGGTGDDVLSGGSGADTYTFGADSGQDEIVGWDGEDRISVDGVEGVSSFDDLNITQDADGNAVIDFGNGNQVTLNGVSPDDLDADDFDFS